MNPIDALRDQMRALLDERATATARVRTLDAATRGDAARTLTDTEEAEVRSLTSRVEAIDTEVGELEAREQELTEQANRDQRAADLRARLGGGPVVESVNEPELYRKGGPNSFFRDLARRTLRNDAEASARLGQHQRAMTTTDGAGGELIPPTWIMSELIEMVRAGRVTADQVRRETWPGGTDSISLPRVTTGTAVAQQATVNSNLNNQDMATDSVTAAVKTVGGVQTVPQQLIDLSPLNIDQIVLGDLAADYAVKVDQFVISNNATNAKGILSASGTNAVTYTDASPTLGELYAKVADAVRQVHEGRLLPPDKIIMHPRRWAWCLSALDSSGRPLVTPYGPSNAPGTMGGVVSQGLVGQLQGLPVYVDPNIPTNLGAGTNEDRIIVMRSSDVILYESTPRAEAFAETKAEQLSVLFRIYGYLGVFTERLPKAISVISGTGLVTPTF